MAYEPFVFGVLMSPSHPSPSAAWVVAVELSDAVEFAEVSDSLVSDESVDVSVVASAVVAVVSSVVVDSAVVTSLVDVSPDSALTVESMTPVVATPASVATATAPVIKVGTNAIGRLLSVMFRPFV